MQFEALPGVGPASLRRPKALAGDSGYSDKRPRAYLARAGTEDVVAYR